MKDYTILKFIWTDIDVLLIFNSKWPILKEFNVVIIVFYLNVLLYFYFNKILCKSKLY